jgi:predicted nucleic acid-binding protein
VVIVLDTNVVSEPLKKDPSDVVLRWLVAEQQTAITAITVGELWVGVGSLPDGRRRSGLAAAVARIMTAYSDHVLPYDLVAAREYAVIREECRRRGRAITAEDGMIAGIVRARGARLATRNTRDFAGLGIDVVDPWAHTP